MQKIKQFVSSVKEDLVAFARDLVRIESLTGKEGELAILVEQKMIALGYDDVTVDEAGNVIGRIGRGEITVLYDSHMDTVDVKDAEDWTVGPFEGHIENGKLYGRGSVDTKGALAATVYAGYIIKKMGLDEGKTIYISASVMEEDIEGLPLFHLCKQNNINPDYAVIGEPSSLGLALGNRGRALLRVDVEGISSHAATPGNGVNAVYKMADIIKRVEKLSKNLSKAKSNSGSVALTKIECETASLNAVPAKSSIYLDRRLTIVEDEEFVRGEMDKLLEGTDATWEICHVVAQSWTGKVLELTSFLPAWQTDEESILSKACVEAFTELNGRPPRIFTWDFSTNGVATANWLGVPTVGFGPGDSTLAHAKDENCRLSDIVEACEFYAALASRL